MKKNNLTLAVLAGAGMCVTAACVKIPADADYISPSATYTQTLFEPVLGRTSLIPGDPGTNIFNKDNSTSPLNFKIINMRGANGEAADIFNKTFPVLVWKEPYTGLEKTREEIDRKRTIEQRRLFEVREHSGQFVMWRPEDLAYLNAIKKQPDPGYKFDVEVSNSGGSKIVRNLELKPLRPQPYEPNAFDPVTGNSYGEVTPRVVSNIKVMYEDQTMGSMMVKMIFYKNPDTKGNTLTFEFRDSAYRPIDPKLFRTTKWEEMIHHFGTARFTPEAVTYEVAYPIPLSVRPTRYTNGAGNRAMVSFTYDRMVNGQFRSSAILGTDFAIYEPGDWKIVFWFHKRNPDFKDN
ncbi:DUF5007 domain-containing protein [Chitinophaga sp. Mgbs1]|uniref:DUF5007 domain-containing protein n=1 Tax=Chitinophaga solisilvae TaxID=1233460 RepID=A0A3S1JF36_9BACT|nr:DUF5007 domain-containing protein [Chitinophaga solisilvae]